MAWLLSAGAAAPVCAAEYALADLFRTALGRSEKLKVAEENLLIAELGREKALSYLLPRVTATAGATQYSERKHTASGSVLQPENATSWGLRVEETFSLSGRELTALEMARQGVTRSRYDLASLREDYLLRNVATSYYGVLMARKNLDIADANLERLTKYREAAEKRLRVGEVTKTALLRAEGELSGAKSDRLQAANAFELARAVLASSVGLRESFTLREEAEAREEIPALEVFREEALRTRSDLKGLEIQKQVAADQIKYAEGAFWPSLTLSGVYTGTDQNPATSNLNRESLYGGVALNFPFFEGGLRKAELSEARARERQAVLLYDDARKTIEVEVQSAYLDLQTQAGIARFLSDQLAFAQDNYQAVTRQFEFGLSNSLDVLDANALLVSAERKAASADYHYRLAHLKLKRATGTLLSAAVPSL
jgi:outer membrane protein